MGDLSWCDYLESYRKFFEKFFLSVDPSDQLPVKVAGYNLIEPEIDGAVADWSLQYLEQRRCPPCLLAPLVRKVVEEVRVLRKVNPASCGYRSDYQDYLPLKCMQTCVAKLVEVCSRYRDNAELSSLPPPSPLPLVTSCAVKNSRRSMEDRHVVIHDFHAQYNITGHGPAGYYAVFDGHNGADAAVYSVCHLHQYLAESPHYPTQPVRALRHACQRTDQLFTSKAKSENLHGGTTAVFALMRPKERKLYVAWLGDSQAVLVRRGVPVHIVRPHKPDRTDERDRIENMGGTVLYWGAWRVNGQLAVSRAIGDTEYKPYVTAEPDVEVLTLDGSEDFLVLACDGLWDYVTDQEATDAVYRQLQDNPEDVEAVSQRLVALAKEQSSQDNISVVVVFLAAPAEVAKRHLMETQAQSPPNPFVGRNGSDLLPLRYEEYQHDDHEDEEDFGPETDVDMVDDVIMSPTIAAAKALVQDTACRDTPTPPAHEVENNANVESGGEESEEEWNYIPGDDTKPQSTDTQVDDDMSSQLNPDAAEFVPVSPTRLMLQDDAIIAASPRSGHQINMDDIQVPSEYVFTEEISQRPGDTNGPKDVGDYFMRDNFSTLRNKSKDINDSSTCAELGDDSIISLNSSLNSSSCVQEDTLDKLNSVQSLEEKVNSVVFEKENLFGLNNFGFNNSDAFGATNAFGKSDPMTTSVIDHKGFSDSSDPYDALPGTPKSTVVEAPGSPTNGDVSPINQQNDFDSPSDDIVKSSKLESPNADPLENLTSGQERTSSSGFESETGAEEGIPEDNDGHITELESPPIDLSYKPIETFSDTNPFGDLKTSSATTPLEHNDVPRPTHLEGVSEFETPKKDMLSEKQVDASHDFLQSTPSSFISLRKTPEKDEPVPFDQLESPTEIPHFEPPPNANSQLLTTKLPESPENESFEGVESSLDQETQKLELDNQLSTCISHENKHDIPAEQTMTNEYVESDIESGNSVTETQVLESKSLSEHLNDTAEFLELESKIKQDEAECEQLNKEGQELKSEIISNTEPSLTVLVEAGNDVAPSVESPISNEDRKLHIESVEKDILNEDSPENETREMNLEFESHIAKSNSTLDEEKVVGHDFETKLVPDDTNSLDDGFEVINKEDICIDDHIEMQEDLLNQKDPLSPSKQTNPFLMDETLPSENKTQTETVEKEHPGQLNTDAKTDLLNAIDNFSFAMEDTIQAVQNIDLNSSPSELLLNDEPKATKTVSYQTLTPADEPKLTKVQSYVTGIEETTVTDKIVPIENLVEGSQDVVQNESAIVQSDGEIKSSDIKETVTTMVEPVLSQVVTETLITALEETSEMPSAPTVEVPSTAGTPPPTPAPGLEGSEHEQKTDILVAAVAAAGAVAAGTAVAAVTESKKSTAASKKPLGNAAKKTAEPLTKATAKPAPSKTAAKPAATKSTTTTTKPLTKAGTTATRPAGVGSAAKSGSGTSATVPTSATAKPTTKPSVGAATATKKPVPATGPKAPAPAAAKPAAASRSAPSLTKAAPPKQLSVSKTTMSTLKPSSKPTTPTTPKSPSVKSDVVKSPTKPPVKSMLATKPTGAVKSAAADKKPLTNGDVKPAKKIEVPDKKFTATKSVAAKPLGAKPASAGANKPATASAPPRAKPATTTTSVKSAPAPAKRPSTAPATAGKTAVNKPGTNIKSAVNGKTAPSKTAIGAKKTDPKVQEDRVSTTNGHIIDEQIIENH